MNRPRPILKTNLSSTSSHDRDHVAVHFPPSPTLTRTFAVYSSSTYDRSPIVVGPNSCALPERGCPGRTYTLEEQSAKLPKGQHIHPRSMNNYGLGLLFGDDGRQVPIGQQYLPQLLPPLVPDLSSSESDESDNPLHNFPPSPIPSASDDRSCLNNNSNDVTKKQRKRVRSPSRRRSSPRPTDSDDDLSLSKSSRSKYRPISEKSIRSCGVLALPDEGCFGGF